MRHVQQDRFHQLSEGRDGMQCSARHTRESTRPPPRQPKISSVGLGSALGQLSLPDLDGCTWTNSNVLPLKCGKCKSDARQTCAAGARAISARGEKMDKCF